MQDINDKVIETTLEVGKETVFDLVKPTAQSIGKNVGLLVDGAMGWIGLWGEIQKLKREKYLKDYKERIIKNLEKIPEDDLV